VKLVSILKDGDRLAGVLEGDDVFVTTVRGLDVAIEQGIELKGEAGRWTKRNQLTLDVPLRPGSLLCTGSNYRDHLEERVPASGGLNAPPKELEFFVKAGQTIAPLDAPLCLDPAFGRKIDQETELGIVMRPGCVRKIPEERARSYIFGYLVVNDLTAREKQVRLLPDGSNFMVLGASKNFDGSTRLSSYVVTADEVEDIDNVAIKTYLNDKLTQNNSTSNLINSLERAISFFSEGLTLQPAGIISTGTPGGTGWGQDRELRGTGYLPPGCSPGRYLRAGDVVRSVVEGVGEIVFRVE
jgi:2-keto-4-pentenoate hydratase/2-oxohepta-3-ene-1,7-dioic acid hydratase in catechol pathway